MSKKIISLLLVFIFVFPMLPLGYVKGAEYDIAVTDVKVYENGERLTGLKAGTLTVNVTLVNSGETPVTPFVVAMICKGTKDIYQTVSFAGKDDVVFIKDTPNDVSLSLECASVEDSFLKVMIFDNKNDLNVLSEQYYFPSEKDITLTDIKIDGTSVSGFNPQVYEYAVEMPFEESFPTEFSYTLYNSSALVEMTKPTAYGEYLKIEVSIDGYGKNEYKILITEAPDPKIPSVSNVKYNGEDGKIISPFVVGTYRYSDNQDAFSDFSGIEFSKNSYYIQPKYSDYKDENFKNRDYEWLSFSINRSADVYVVSFVTVSGSYMPWLSTQGYKVIGEDGTLLAPTTKEGKLMLGVTTGSTNAGRKNAYLYKKTYELPSDGKTKETISFGGDGLGDERYGVYGVIVDFKDESLFLSDIKVNGESLVGFDRDKTEYELYNLPGDADVTYTKVENSSTVTKDVTDEKITLTVSNGKEEKVYTILRKEKRNDLQVIQTLSSSYNIVDSFDANTKRFADQSYGFTNFDGFLEVIKGHEVIYIQTAYNDRKNIATNYTQSDAYMTLKLNATANIYVLTPFTIESNTKNQKTLKDWEPVIKSDGETLYKMTNAESSNVRKRAYLYKKKVTVSSIYDYQTVTINCPLDNPDTNGNNYVYTVLVEFLPETQETSSVFKRGLTVFAEELTDKVTSLNGKAQNGVLTVSGESTVLNGDLSVFVQNNADLNSKDYSKIIYLNSVKTDSDGKFTAKVPLYEIRGTLQYFAGEKSGEITYAPIGDNNITSFKLSNTSASINGTNITLTLPSGTDVRGLIANFDVHKDAAVYVNDILQTSGVSKNDFTNSVEYKVTADDGTVKTYTVTVTVPVVILPPSGGGGGGGNVGGVSSGGGPSNVEVTKPENPAPPVTEEIIYDTFSDVKSSHWAYVAIEKLSSKGIINGFSDGEFKPEEEVTREQAVKMLVSAFGIVPGDITFPEFSDVDKSQWYNFYIEIAVESGIVNGMSQTEFGIGKSVTREDAAVILNRIINKKSLQFTEEDKLGFTDSKDFSDYSFDAVEKISSYGLIKGYPDGTFNPKGFMTRAEFSVLLQRALKI